MSERLPSRSIDSPPKQGDPAGEAAAWIVRRDRGLSAEEELNFDHWRRNADNARLLAEIEGSFSALDRLAQLRPADGSPPDRDFLITRKRRPLWYRYRVTGGLAAAAAVVVGLMSHSDSWRTEPAVAARSVVIRQSTERLALSDGSTIELKPGTRVEVDFSGVQRGVRLTAGDAHFTVAKDPARPFVVSVGTVTVQAIGTAFTISASSAMVEVVVTEGRVRVGDLAGRSLIVPSAGQHQVEDAPSVIRSVPAVDAGHYLTIPMGGESPAPVPVTVATPEVLERASAWRGVWLEFGELPLSEVVREFNRQAANHRQPLLRTADERTGRVLVSGKFRTDGIDAFVRLLDSSLGIEAKRGSDGILALKKMD